jgi:hypothetical protein
MCLDSSPQCQYWYIDCKYNFGKVHDGGTRRCLPSGCSYWRCKQAVAVAVRLQVVLVLAAAEVPVPVAMAPVYTILINEAMSLAMPAILGPLSTALAIWSNDKGPSICLLSSSLSNWFGMSWTCTSRLLM